MPATSSEFTGRENDGTGLYYFRARYYSSTFQRFIAQDPIGFAGGDANLYAYVKNSSPNLADPFGRQVYPGPEAQQIGDQIQSLPLTSQPSPYCPAPPLPPPQCLGGQIGPEGLALFAGSGFVGGAELGGFWGSVSLGAVTTLGAAALWANNELACRQ